MFERKYHSQDLHSYSFLVTGGAGFIGSNIVEYLVKYNAGKIRILDNLSTGFMLNITPFLDKKNIEFIKGDIRDSETCLAATEDIDYVIHQAALGSVPRSIQDPQTTNQVNISGFLNMLVAVKESKTVKKMVYAASSSTYGDSKSLPKKEDTIGAPLSPYAITKYVNELYADVFQKTYGVSTVGLRYFNVFGPRQDPNGAYAAVIPLFMKAMKENNKPVINGDGEQTRDFTFVENAVQANIKACFSTECADRPVYNIAVGERISLNQLWDNLKQITGNELEPSYGESRVGDICDSLADITKARKFLGYDPKFKILDGLNITWDWFKK